MQITLKNIHKHYGPVKANNGVTLTVEPGTIHGILGENGAGKSTLMKILSGYSRKTSGDILINGTSVDYRTPAQAVGLGLGMLYQDPLDFPLLSVLDNFMLGQRQIAKGKSKNRKAFREQLLTLSQPFDFALDPDAPVKYLTIGERQQLEILRLLALGIQVLILDEPTTGISALQKEMLFQALKKLTREEKSVILVSHKLEDVESLCDRVTVLRQGTVTGEMESPFDTEKLLEMIFGTVPSSATCSDMTPGEEVLIMNEVSAPGERAGLKDCDTVIRQGEVVGLAGLEGSGQGVFLRIAAGLKKPSRGEIALQGKKMTGKGHHVFKQARVNFLPTSRLEEGLIPGLNIGEHCALLTRNGIFVKWADAREAAEKRIEKFHIRGTPESPVESLSGGNQQRLLLSFLSEDPVLLLLENPTRGLDLESARWVWQHLQKYCGNNTSIVFSSSELDEILMVADRVPVFFDGSIVKDVRACDTDVHELGRAIAGVR